MKHALYVHNILDFHPLGVTQNTEIGIRLFQAIVNDYVGHCLPSGNPYLIDPPYPESYIVTLLEGLPGFSYLTERQTEVLIHEAVAFFRMFMDYVEKLATTNKTTVSVYPANEDQTRVALVV